MTTVSPLTSLNTQPNALLPQLGHHTNSESRIESTPTQESINNVHKWSRESVRAHLLARCAVPSDGDDVLQLE